MLDPENTLDSAKALIGSIFQKVHRRFIVQGLNMNYFTVRVMW